MPSSLLRPGSENMPSHLSSSFTPQSRRQPPFSSIDLAAGANPGAAHRGLGQATRPALSSEVAGYRAGVENGCWFRDLPAGLREDLLAHAVVKRLRAGERLYARGDRFDGMYCVAEGAIRIGASSEDGREALLAVAQPFLWLGDVGVFDRLPRIHSADADLASVILHVPVAALDAVLAAEPSYWRPLGLLMAHRMRLAYGMLAEAALLPSPLRVVRRLVLMAESYGELSGQTRRVLEVPQERLAMMLALSRQTANQILKDLETRGLIKLRYGQIEVLQLDELRKLAADT
jgi:CRP/FNR family cyclic AMP-dependent transcriptional regulator